MYYTLYTQDPCTIHFTYKTHVLYTLHTRPMYKSNTLHKEACILTSRSYWQRYKRTKKRWHKALLFTLTRKSWPWRSARGQLSTWPCVNSCFESWRAVKSQRPTTEEPKMQNTVGVLEKMGRIGYSSRFLENSCFKETKCMPNCQILKE